MSSNFAPDISAAIVRPPLTVPPSMPLLEAIACMSHAQANACNLESSGHSEPGLQLIRQHRPSCVMVVQDNKPIGIVTERDIVRLTAAQTSLSSLTVSDVMTSPVVTLAEESFRDMFAALFLFRRYGIRHLPIVNTAGELGGLVTPDRIRRVLKPANLLKMRRVADVMAANVVRALPNASVLDLAQLMATHRVSCVVVAEEDPPDINPVGIVTERDIVQFSHLGLNLASTMAHTVMSCPLTLLDPTDSLWDAHQTMQNLRVRRLVVSWDWGRGLGLVTQTSLLRAFDPMEMYGVIETLQRTVSRLEGGTNEVIGISPPSNVPSPVVSLNQWRTGRFPQPQTPSISQPDQLMNSMQRRIANLLSDPDLDLELRQKELQGLLTDLAALRKLGLLKD